MKKKTKKKINVLLVASSKTDIGFGRVAKIPNLGLYSLAANLERSCCTVNVLELVVAGRNPRKYYQKYIMKYQPDVVGFSCMTFQYAETVALARITKAVSKEILVIIGGYHPTVASDMILNNEEDMHAIDFLMRNEGEVAFNSFIKALYNGDDIRKAPNLSYVENGSIINNPGDGILNLEDIIPQDRNVRVINKGFFLFGNRCDIIETSRGCTSNCDFCSMKIMYGRSYRKYSIERVIHDMMDARNHGVGALFAADDNKIRSKMDFSRHRKYLRK